MDIIEEISNFEFEGFSEVQCLFFNELWMVRILISEFQSSSFVPEATRAHRQGRAETGRPFVHDAPPRTARSTAATPEWIRRPTGHQLTRFLTTRPDSSLPQKDSQRYNILRLIRHSPARGTGGAPVSCRLVQER
jgi:hypothetical protein